MRRTTAAVVLAVGLLSAACASTETGTATAEAGSAGSTSASTAPSGSSSASTSASAAADTPPGDLSSLALTAADFPPPFQFTEVPAGALDSATSGGLGGAEITPAECGRAADLNAGVDLSTVGIAVATDPATFTTLVATVAPITLPLDQLDSVVQSCSAFTVTLPGSGTADASITALPNPQVDADGARAISTTVTVQLGGSSTAVTTVVYVAEVRGLQVSVGASGVSGGAVDPSVLDGLLTTAVAKVAAG